MKRLLGIDVGTTAMKAGLYDDKLNEIASCSAEYGLITEGGRVECDPETYVKMLTDCIGRVAGGLSVGRGGGSACCARGKIHSVRHRLFRGKSPI